MCRILAVRGVSDFAQHQSEEVDAALDNCTRPPASKCRNNPPLDELLGFQQLLAQRRGLGAIPFILFNLSEP
jgi:hypothetical protein